MIKMRLIEGFFFQQTIIKKIKNCLTLSIIDYSSNLMIAKINFNFKKNVKNSNRIHDMKKFTKKVKIKFKFKF